MSSVITILTNQSGVNRESGMNPTIGVHYLQKRIMSFQFFDNLREEVFCR